MIVKPRVIIITGEKQSGKTSLAEELVGWMKEQDLNVAGILACGHWHHGQRSGFDLVDLADGRLTALARRNPGRDKDAVTGFTFFPQGLVAGKAALSMERCRDADWIVVDEIGRLELAGSGWAPQLAPLLGLPGVGHIWIVRQSLIEPVCRWWHFSPAAIVSVEDRQALSIMKDLSVKT